MKLYTLSLQTAEGDRATREIKADCPKSAKQLMAEKFPGCSNIEIVASREQSEQELREEQALREVAAPDPEPPPGKNLVRARLGSLALAGGLLGFLATLLFSDRNPAGCLVCWVATLGGVALLLFASSSRSPRRSADSGPRARQEKNQKRRH